MWTASGDCLAAQMTGNASHEKDSCSRKGVLRYRLPGYSHFCVVIPLLMHDRGKIAEICGLVLALSLAMVRGRVIVKQWN